MNNKPILMIHEIEDRLFDLPLHEYILTFDDGLYSHYYHFDKFKDIETEKIFFISTGIICNGTQSKGFPNSVVAHEKAFAGNYEDFMTLAQIVELRNQPNVTIGAHGHSHKDLNTFATLNEQIKHISNDTRLMLSWFSFHFGYIPTSFCFPYNNDLHGMYTGLLKKYGFTDFYGKERIDGSTLSNS